MTNDCRNHYIQAIALESILNNSEPPRVTLKGSIAIADEIVRFAKKHGIPVVDDAPLVDALLTVPLDHQIPPELFEAAAIVFHELDSIAKR